MLGTGCGCLILKPLLGRGFFFGLIRYNIPTMWLPARLAAKQRLSATMWSLVFDVPGAPVHRCGQFYDVALELLGTVSCCYSVISTPVHLPRLEFGVELIEGGRVSPGLCGLQVGAEAWLRGPSGLQSYSWDETMPGPLVLIAGGSGVAGIMAMARLARETRTAQPDRPIEIIVSATAADHLVYDQELCEWQQQDTVMNYTSVLTQGARRIDALWLGSKLAPVLGSSGHAYVCGSPVFVADVRAMLSQIGWPASRIHSEYFA